ncbi:Ribonuclease toxin, BrnT, of type II toxin-antitoxin system [Rubritalea squalenifaciens DSM 18772]|uniref:Ribonuclease toxin, BrnT, of type II toxin-antitoxin system n=2 Tax=Rubritalea TaxID=361050 RepID=A0A1M6NCX7_9BACT|nr:BrnT family toxin [Rubritalea squalenifaciens]SHJ93561.1 Ribonuclease toxin, BrnT, of type II toxin-antitoxin system [Rubritalea squalenifaciens DSM 18772]
MELDLIDVCIDLKKFKPRELEEVLEDPFTVRFLPDNERTDGESRYYMLGRTVGDRYLFLAFSTDGKKARVVAVREMTEGEKRFYDRRYAEYK